MRAAAWAAAAVLGLAAPAAAQTGPRPGPWVVDVRGVTSQVPTDAGFYPVLDATTLIPSRGFGVDVGGHLYFLDLGPARVGAGAALVYLRATGGAPDTSADDPAETGVQTTAISMRILAPHVSFNFGTSAGWSYLSAGLGPAHVSTRTAGVLQGKRESGTLRSVNLGGGARWFLSPRVAFGFDIRMHRIGAGTAVDDSTPGDSSPTPAMTQVAVGAGFSFR